MGRKKSSGRYNDKGLAYCFRLAYLKNNLTGFLVISEDVWHKYKTVGENVSKKDVWHKYKTVRENVSTKKYWEGKLAFEFWSKKDIQKAWEWKLLKFLELVSSSSSSTSRLDFMTAWHSKKTIGGTFVRIIRLILCIYGSSSCSNFIHFQLLLNLSMLFLCKVHFLCDHPMWRDFQMPTRCFKLGIHFLVLIGTRIYNFKLPKSNLKLLKLSNPL